MNTMKQAWVLKYPNLDGAGWAYALPSFCLEFLKLWCRRPNREPQIHWLATL